MDTKKGTAIDRRSVIKGIGLATGAALISPVAFSQSVGGVIEAKKGKKKKVLRVVHITDVHIRPEHNAPNRFRQCLEEIKKHNVDFFLNGGDTIYAADYNYIKRERVKEQWDIWKSLRKEFLEYEVHSCLGNHDMWWAAPSKEDAMHGKDYVVKQLEIPGRYYSFNKKGWHFVILDSNNKNAGSLDSAQREWLEVYLNTLEQGANILFMSHYPIIGVNGGTHSDRGYITDLLYSHKDKNITCISGHIHLLDSVLYNNVSYFCNGALSGFWWEAGDENSAGKCWVEETPPGYAIIDLYEDGTVENTYYPHSY